MDNYKILTEKSNYTHGENMKKFVVILVTSESDIPLEIPEEWETGSICIIASSHTYKWLTKERKWM